MSECRVFKKLLLHLIPDLLPLPEFLLPPNLLLPFLEQPLELHHLFHLSIEDHGWAPASSAILGVSCRRQVLISLHTIEGVVERNLTLVDRFHLPQLDLGLQIP